jgi:hypothetical protein
VSGAGFGRREAVQSREVQVWKNLPMLHFVFFYLMSYSCEVKENTDLCSEAGQIETFWSDPDPSHNK